LTGELTRTRDKGAFASPDGVRELPIRQTLPESPAIAHLRDLVTRVRILSFVVSTTTT